MSSRDIILAAVKANQPDETNLPDISAFNQMAADGSVTKFEAMLTMVGGKIAHVAGYHDVINAITESYGKTVRIITPIRELKQLTPENLQDLVSIHDLHNVEVAVLRAQFGVAENGAVWITENEMIHRVLPFVTQHLAVIIKAADIVPTMHKAYERIGEGEYSFGSFIAGPSKTADIEQSLVIGAHGPRSMTVFVMDGAE